jgi:hypothetical protein
MSTKEQVKLTQEMVDSMDWDALDKIVGAYLDAYIRFVVKFDKSKENVDIQNDHNLSHSSGIFRHIFSDIRVDNFGGCLSEDGKIYYLPLHISWTYKSGGTNGATLFNIHYYFASKRWFIADMH